jgi:uncharacterized YigZ family protein
MRFDDAAGAQEGRNMAVTISGSAETELVVKKSRFLGFACHVESEEEAQRVLEQRRRQHYDARHHCFAYVLKSGVIRYGDDGEPQGTAGLPMLEVLKKTGLTDVIVVSTRYFGGTLLGAGGLLRAYTQNAADTLAAVKRVRREECAVFQCRFSFSAWARAEKALASLGFSPGGVRYTDMVTAEYCVRPGEEEKYCQAISDITQGKVSAVLLGVRMVEMEI